MSVKSTFKAGVLAAGLCMAAPASAQAPLSAQSIEAVRDSYIFVFRDGVGEDRVRAAVSRILQAHGLTQRHVYTAALRGFSARMPAAIAAAIAAANPDIAYYEADKPVYAFAGGTRNGVIGGLIGGIIGGPQPAQQTPYGITRVNGGTGTAGGTAWVIDTGIDSDHPDLNVDVGRSANFVTLDLNTIEDFNGHGTHVAGTIAALDNDIGVVGVAPGAPVAGIRVLGTLGFGSTSDVIAGVDHVAANAAPGDVANMSLGGGASDALDSAVRAAADRGILFVLAAGNDSADANTTSPARVEHPNVWTVSATDETDGFASFSNFGNPPVDCAAPGVGVLSTYLNGGYETLSGTSMAAPHVAGILLLGAVRFDGVAIGDPDGSPDPICVF